MSKGSMAALVGFVTACLLSFGQQACRGQNFSREDFRLDDPALLPAPSPGTLFNRGLFPSSLTINWVTPLDTLPPPSRLASKNVNAPAKSVTNLSDRLAGWAPKVDYASGEIGFLYGKATGKYGGEFKQAYIMGEAGNDKTQIFAGAIYQDSSFRFPRQGH